MLDASRDINHYILEVSCKMPAVILIAGYWKCLAPVGPTFDTNFVSWFFHLCTGYMELKAQTISARCIYSFIYFLHLIGMGIQEETYGFLKHSQIAERKRCKTKGLCGKGGTLL